LIENYGLGEAAKGLYEFIWHDFCDWYIELTKSRLFQKGDPVAKAVLGYVLDGILRLLHPFMPHITEEIWSSLNQSNQQFLSLQTYPETNIQYLNPPLEESFNFLIGVIRTIRNLRAEAAIKPAIKVNIILQSESLTEKSILLEGKKYIQDLAKVEQISLVDILEEQYNQSLVSLYDTTQIVLPLKGVIDISPLLAKLVKSIAKVEKDITNLNARLNKPGFLEQAPGELIQETRASLAEAEKQLLILQQQYNRLS